MFQSLHELFTETNLMAIEERIVTDMISRNICSIKNSHFFTDFHTDDFGMACNPFSTSIQSVPEDDRDEFTDLVNDNRTKDLFQRLGVIQFWCHMIRSFPKTSSIAVRTLFPFTSAYLCKSALSHLLLLKSKVSNKETDDFDDDLGCALSKTQTRVSKIADEMQPQPSH